VADYRSRFTDLATEFILSLPKRRQRQVMAQAQQLAHYPFVESDYRLPDEDGHEIEHLLVDGLVFSYWVDHSSRVVLITEIDDADSG
jgi:hypothetical protein